MRIISGSFRGRKLKSPRGVEVRPTSDRLRETLFDIVGPAVAGAVVLDVFAGSGAIGLEALSRGARAVVFVEASKDACRLIRENAALCGVRSDYRVLNRDAFTALRLLGREAFRADLVFMDPPYRWEPYGDLLEIVFRAGITHAGSRVVIEHHRKAVLPGHGKEFQRLRTVVQSDKCLSFYQAVERAREVDDEVALLDAGKGRRA